MNTTKLPIIYTVDVSQGERDFPGAMTFAWDQEWQAESPGQRSSSGGGHCSWKGLTGDSRLLGQQRREVPSCSPANTELLASGVPSFPILAQSPLLPPSCSWRYLPQSRVSGYPWSEHLFVNKWISFSVLCWSHPSLAHSPNTSSNSTKTSALSSEKLRSYFLNGNFGSVVQFGNTQNNVARA